MKKKEKEEAENYLIFARKFRPETFDEIVGQEATTQVLKNAIRMNRIPQSFLFSGPRGIGKTSTARILAKALNCAQGPTESPCNECSICQEITRAVSFDVLEIDGASNRGIEEIRTLRENVKFKPAQARFKIYIIDEVHQITHDGFNALLKTLEEPPPHVKFIFATTEPHKVPLTILSRCQRFNFKRIPTEGIAAKLAEITKAEKLKADPKALFLIARQSDGSLRDAETLLDQLAVLSKGTITEEDVLFALGLAGEEVYFDLLKALGAKEASKILSLTKELYESGRDLVQFGRGLYELFRNLLLLQLGQGAEAFVEMSPESKKELAQFKDAFSREELLLVLSLLQNLQGDLRRALAPPKLLLETALLKLLHLEGLHSVKELIEKGEEGKASSLRGSTQSKAEAISEPGLLRRPSGPPRNDVGAQFPPKIVAGPTRVVADIAPTGGTRLRVRQSRVNSAPTLPPMGPLTSFTLSDIQRVWPQVIEAVKAKEMSTGMFLAEAEPMEVTDQIVVLGLPEEFQFHKEMLERAEKRKLIEGVFSQFLGEPPQVQFVTTQLLKGEGSPGAAPEKSPAKLPEIVRQAMDIFKDSKVVRAD